MMNNSVRHLLRATSFALSLVFFVSYCHGQASPGTQTAPTAPPAPSLYTPGATANTQTSPAATPTTQAAPDTSIQVPTLSRDANEVTLDLMVHDKHHKPILDLKPEDLVITDNDTQVKINGLHLVSGKADSDHLVTLVFDRFNGATAKNAQSVAMKILKMLPDKGYSYSVLDLAGHLRLIQGFTDDKNTVAQAVKVITEKAAADRNQVIQLTYSSLMVNRNEKPDSESTKAAADAEKYLIAVTRTGADPSGNHVGVIVRTRYQTLLAALEDSRRIMQDQHTLPNLAGLTALVKSQQKVAERKSLIYFTQNMQMDNAGKEMIKTVTGAAGQAGVSIYVVDLDAMNSQGRSQIQNALLNGQPPFSPAKQDVTGSGGLAQITPMQQQGSTPLGAGSMAGGGLNWGPKEDIAQMTDFMRNGWEGNDPLGTIKSPMADLAKDTGGTYIDAQDNTKRSLQQMLQDMTTYYQASYVPPIQDYDGSYRTISTKVLRSGLDVKTKTGYFALAPGAEGGIRPFEVPLLKVFAQPQLPQDLKFHTSILQFGDLPDGNTSAVAIEVPLSEVETKKDMHTNLFSAHVSIVAEIKDKSGTVVEHFGEDIARRGALETIDTDKSAAITLQRHFMAIPGQYVLEAVVYDQFGQKAGAKRMNFEIPPVQSALSLSDIVLVKKVDTFHEEDDPLEPMKYEKGKITPNLSAEVPDDAKSVSLFFILHPDPKSKEPLTLEMEASRNGRPGKRMPLPLHLNSEDATVPYLASFKAGSLQPGAYEVKAMLSQGGKTAIQRMSFTVAGGLPGNVTSEIASANLQGHGGAPAASDSPILSDANDSYAGELAITASTNPLPTPTPEEVKQLIADARDRAVNYAESLPNFLCVEVTNRSYDPTGTGKWKHRDTISELLRYRDKKETHTTLEIDGKASDVDRGTMLQKKSSFSTGELGGVLRAVFEPSAKAEFQWKETDSLGSGTVQVFEYRVAKANSEFAVTGMNDKQITVGFHGQVFVDSATRNVRRISLDADDIPRDFPTHATTIGVDYDYVAINGHDYLMPIGAEVRLLQGRHEAVMNSMEFRNYRRFGANMKILGFTPMEGKQQ
jgi:VWFA-related protein